MPAAEVPTIDISALCRAPTGDAQRAVDTAARRSVGSRIVDACETAGVFRIVGHGVDPHLRLALLDAATRFFSLPDEEKGRVAMPRAGRAWRGWFPLGGELTAGAADHKEGLYFGIEHPSDDPRVLAGLPLHGANQFPEHPAELASLVASWMTSITEVGRVVLRGLASGMGLEDAFFDLWCADPTVLFRIFRYPARDPLGPTPTRWGVGEHTDYGLLTLLTQDGTGGLQVDVEGRWVDVDADPDAIVCNLGDMLQVLSAGRFVATPHRVVAPVIDRISMPLFLDPGWDVQVRPLPGAGERRAGPADPPGQRWDGADLGLVDGPYSEYLLGRVARVFPEMYDTAVRTGSQEAPEDG